MKITEVSIDDLHPYERNARTHSPEQLDQVAASIKQFGWTNPVIIDGSNGIIAGHGRVQAAKNMGLEKVPTIQLTHLSDAEKRAYILADNQLALNAGWDQDMLAAELHDIEALGFDLTTIGFESNELDQLLGDRTPGGTTHEDAVPDVPKKAITQPGDVWVLGDHLLICGDSTKAETYDALMEDHQAQTLWTDPPYNVDYKNDDGEGIQNDNMAAGAFISFLTDAFTAAAGKLEPGRGVYIAHADINTVPFRDAAASAGIAIKQCLIWVKNSFSLTRSDYQWQHEPILYGWREGAAHQWYGEYDKSTIIDDDSDPTKLTKDELLEAILELRRQSSIIRHNKPQRNALHPTMKPVDLITRMIKCTAKQGEVVLDPFGGSGSTLIACEKTRRHCRTIELDPKFCDVIVNRWQDYTGNEAYLDEGEQFEAVAIARA